MTVGLSAQLVKRKIAQKKAEKVQRMQDAQRSMLPVYGRSSRVPSSRYEEPMRGRWYNHATGQMDDYDPPKKKYDYYKI